jgi:hypothetical protein
MNSLSFNKIPPGRMTFPDDWLIKAKDRIWPIKEGLWFRNKGEETFARIMYASASLLELPEARQDLNECISLFMEQLAPDYHRWTNRLKFDVSKYKVLAQKQKIFGTDMNHLTKMVFKNQDEILSVYQPWSNKWALGSELMSAWVGMETIYNDILSWFGEDPNFYKKEMYSLKGDFVRMMASSFDVDDKENWYTTLNPNQPKSEKGKRQEARKTFVKKGYYKKRDPLLLTHSRWWIIVRILGYRETDVVEKFLPQYDEGEGSISKENFYNLVLKPYDESFSYKPRIGRPKNN